MTKQTKLELVQINTRLAAENEALRKQVADLQHDARVAGDIVAHLSTPAPRYVTPQWQIDRAIAMAAARDMAMRTRMVTKV